MNDEDRLSKHIASTYHQLRIGFCAIALIFPILLWMGGRVIGHPDTQGRPLLLQHSMSAYYHAESNDQVKDYADPERGVMRNYFVGLLFGLGIILILYKGYSGKENLALNLTGFMAIGVALFPTSWGADYPGLEYKIGFLETSVHGTCAVLLFVCMGYVCIFRAKDTLKLVKDPNNARRYLWTYRALGISMIASPITAFIFDSLSHGTSYVFWLEAAGIWSFSLYWFFKSIELAGTDAERKAICKELNVSVTPGAVPMTTQVEITEKKDTSP